ncbi:hypothetical protein AAVH_22617 [Aphelenchoides avenae]|nr:hypothetical protein AAVH_22616 [Aphelenchus avenae]KAH7710096.1 hypothetical protein AAVH_22617 [Aphelenchus avenae]
MILENCVQSVFENAVSQLTFTHNLPPHMEANLLDRACTVLLRRFGRFETSRLILRFGEARIEVNAYRFSDGTTVIDESLFTSDAFRRSSLAEVETENIARQLVKFFMSEWWTYGNCTFYVPRDLASAAGPLIDQLASTRECRWLRKPFGQHLFQYDFRIEDLLGRWQLIPPSDAAEDARNCGKGITLSEQERNQQSPQDDAP